MSVEIYWLGQKLLLFMFYVPIPILRKCLVTSNWETTVPSNKLSVVYFTNRVVGWIIVFSDR